jgi:hypothetical protein
MNIKKILSTFIALLIVTFVIAGSTGCQGVKKVQKQDDLKIIEKTETKTTEDTQEATPAVTTDAPTEVSDVTKEVDALFTDLSKDSLDDVSAEEFSE